MCIKLDFPNVRIIQISLQYRYNSSQYLSITSMACTTFIHKKLSYFFTRSERIDLQIGLGLNLSMNYCLDILQQVTFVTSSNNKSKNKILQASISLLSQVVKICQPAQPYDLTQQSPILTWQFGIDPQKYAQFYENDGLRCCVFALRNYIDYLGKSTAKSSIVDEMIVKTLLNLIYVVIYSYRFIFELIEKGNFRASNTRMKTAIQELQLDALLIKLVTLTLDTFYLPIKKLVLLYTRVLAALFAKPGSGQDLYEDSEMLDLSLNNLLTENYLQLFKEKNKPGQIKNKSKENPVEAFYAKNNVGECPLAQSIVVGLLRSLLTICNSQSHKKFQLNLPKGSGADSYREWQISYQFVIQMGISKDIPDYKKYLSTSSTKYLKDYIQYNDMPSENPADKQPNSPLLSMTTHYQFYRHKIYTTLAISTFFSFLLISFKKNAMIQFTYLYQLISEANGVLVFLKFLTDKFQSLEPVQDIELSVAEVPTQKKANKTQYCKCSSLPFMLTFQDEVMLAVYSVLLVLYGACNNYTEKTRSYLFEYNSYLIIKKIPHIFMKVHKNDDQLPSEQEIEAEFGSSSIQRKSSEANDHQNTITKKVKELTQLCYSLLKIQIPFFSKKMKQNANNMKMIIQIYCQMPKKMDPIQRTELDKLLLKNQMRKIQNQKYILSVEELKGVHNEYNNLYYWSNQQAKINEGITEAKENVEPLTISRQEMEKWLEENVWKFYD